MNLWKSFVVVMFIGLVVGCSKEPVGKPAKEAKGEPEAKQADVQPEVKKAVSQSEAKEAAVQAAQDWLALVDGGKNAESWEQSAELFRAAVTQEKWVNTLKAVRSSVGAIISREVASATYLTTVPNGPEGEYVVIQFSSSVKNKPAVVETVTPMLDKDGVWRVSGYFIR
ncbi:MAG: DUF4019 domain-containing protein [Sedimentisphaerales bacterium]|nr:DUF4019 domain-containing protein [Sedimentisphaerales bacterium]